eukprot:gnl/Trimastix_PCT/2158.p1 GENE.gnl/Trimastix_PCT/2158~~gnl/Trimastix_PCT/2158.p1  ORF type:complete len:470 (-),score=115.37 gnl/Trimastix_PCT/2158:266-1675(-)
MDPLPPQQPEQPNVSVGVNDNQCASLYVGNLSESISEGLLSEVFGAFGAIKQCKVIKDKQTGHSSGYGFVDFYDHMAAESAMQVMNGRDLYGCLLKVNWAFQSHQRENDMSGAALQIFVGDLASDIDDKKLYQSFQKYPSCCGARCMWDHNTGRSRGYGFVAFRTREDAERAMVEMNGQYIGNRAVRCNWANQKHGEDVVRSGVPGGRASDSRNVSQQGQGQNRTVYIGNLPPDVQDGPIREHFQQYGVIEDIRIQRGQGFAFVTFSQHDEAVQAISNSNGASISGRFCKVAWGRERQNRRQYSYTQQPYWGSDPSMPPMPPMPPMGQMGDDPSQAMGQFDPSNNPAAYYQAYQAYMQYYQQMAPYYSYYQQHMATMQGGSDPSQQPIPEGQGTPPLAGQVPPSAVPGQGSLNAHAQAHGAQGGEGDEQQVSMGPMAAMAAMSMSMPMPQPGPAGPGIPPVIQLPPAMQ